MFDGTGARRLTATNAYEKLYGTWATDLSPRTRKRYRYELERWSRLTGDPPIVEIDTGTFQAFRAASAELGHKPATTESTLRVIRAVLRCAMAHGAIRTMPDRGRPRRIAAPEPHPPSLDELDRFLRAVHVSRWPKTHVTPAVFWRCFVCIDLWTGLRREDAFWKLAWEHIHEDRIEFRAGKTGKLHCWPMTPLVQRHLKLMRHTFKRPASTPIFNPGKSGHSLQRELERICDAAEIRPLTIKSFRQAAVTLWTAADSRAGEILHGVGMPRVMNHYLDKLAILRSAADAVKMPDALDDEPPDKRQGTLWMVLWLCITAGMGV